MDALPPDNAPPAQALAAIDALMARGAAPSRRQAEANNLIT